MPSSDRRRVVMTGAGAVTSLGCSAEATWRAVVEGRSGVDYIRQFNSRAFPVRIGSEVDIERLELAGCEEIEAYLSRSARFGLSAVDEAWRDAGLSAADIDRSRAGVCVGASTFPVVEDNLPDPRRLLDGDRYNADAYLAICRARPELLAQRDISSIATLLALRCDLGGVCMTVQSACTSAAQAIGESFQLIRQGGADLMVTGGADSMLSVICVTGFTLLGALSPRQDEPERASRPFDRKRDGFVLGEGAGIVVLEELEHARSRGARIHAEMIGYGSSLDGYRFTDLRPDGGGAAQCMHAALADAGITPCEVDYINAHGTSTPQNDRVETEAIKNVFGGAVAAPPVSSTKSHMGHLICAAGGVEFILCAFAVQRGILPPTINQEYPDPECDLDYVPNTARTADLQVALSNSFGFGGQNGTLAVRKWAEPGQDRDKAAGG